MADNKDDGAWRARQTGQQRLTPHDKCPVIDPTTRVKRFKLNIIYKSHTHTKPIPPPPPPPHTHTHRVQLTLRGRGQGPVQVGCRPRHSPRMTSAARMTCWLSWWLFPWQQKTIQSTTDEHPNGKLLTLHYSMPTMYTVPGGMLCWQQAWHLRVKPCGALKWLGQRSASI